MELHSRYLLTATMDVDPDKDAVFNEVYDTEHVPSLLRVPGVLSVARYRRRPLTMVIGGQPRTIVLENEPTYTALYALESPGVLVSEAWAKAVELGRWPSEVRPYTRNRRHVLYERLGR
jgi:hypothetical protein